MIKSIPLTKLLNKVSLLTWILLSLGIPLVFTTFTRSVFEINKLTLLRISTVILCSVWLTRYLIDRYTCNIHKSAWQFKGLHWRPTGVEIGLISVSLSLLLSTLFAQNKILSLFGSYDRWEGLITYANYLILFTLSVKLLSKKSDLLLVLWSTLIASAVSGIYGIFQSLGLDPIQWSLDPTLRVFACINNPVHFCAYMGMVMPLCIGLTLYYTKETYINSRSAKKYRFLKISLGIIAILVFYNQYLSFSRATWLGFLGSITLFYLYSSKNFTMKSFRFFSLDIINTVIFIALFYLLFLFKLYLAGPLIACILLIGLALSLSAFCLTLLSSSYTSSSFQGLLSLIFITLLLIAPMNLSLFFGRNLSLLQIGICITLILLSLACHKSHHPLLYRLSLIVFFAHLQFIAVSGIQYFIHITLFTTVFLLGFKQKKTIFKEKKIWLLIYLCLFSLTLSLPVAITHLKISSQGLPPDSAFKILRNTSGKINSYQVDALKGTARSSMWRSSIPWIKDYWLFGTGLDTIKYMYPDYREPEYGPLEGGHHFTPDRLHNEYLNTLATRGIFGFITFYGLFIGGWFWLILRYIFYNRNNPTCFITLACACSIIVYLGQVLFNFGVVPTLFLFFILLGLPISLINYENDN